MAALAAPVTVLTCYDETGAPRGTTASAVTSLSLAPPLLLACLGRTASAHDALVGADSFAVHVLGPWDEELALRFAGPAMLRFAGLSWTADRAPLLDDASLAVCCVRHAVADGGDHTILIGRVVSIAGDGLGTLGGLVWHQRGFARAVPARVERPI
jgi:flavin reductase (DIM6/NTAB) family NADH-FMN oxidoreductase RutF